MTAPRPNPAILKIAPYVGGEAHLSGVNRVIKLSSNEGAFGPPPAAMAAATRAAAEMHRYPDGDCHDLRQAIGSRFGLDPARIVCGNGSDELLSLLIHAYAGPGAEVIMSAHGFVMYDIASTGVGATVIKAPERDLRTDVDAILAAVSPATRMVMVANPNNPTGSLLPQSEMERLRAGLPPDVLLLIDAAYSEYVDRPDYDAGVKLVDAGDNTVMTRTFSKIFGMGGLRLGWCYAPPAIIDVLNRSRGPFNVNLAAQEAGIAALSEQHWVEAGRAHNATQRRPSDGGARGARHQGLAERRQLPAGRFHHRRRSRNRRCSAAPARHHRAGHARLQPPALPADHGGHGRGVRHGGGGARRPAWLTCLPGCASSGSA